MKKIGISSYFLHPDPTRDIFWPKTIACFETQLCDYVSMFESICWPIVPLSESTKLSYLLDQLDGLVLQGGSDVDPKNYGQQNLDPSKWKNDPKRDEFELKLIKMAIEREIPIMGICRGAQLLNVYFGGTLIQDIPGHRNREIYDNFSHTIHWGSESILNEIYPLEKGTGVVNSIHHQCLDFIPKNLIPIATSFDSRIEGFYDDSNHIIGVQWHPEFSHQSKLLNSESLYRWFLNRCG